MGYVYRLGYLRSCFDKGNDGLYSGIKIRSRMMCYLMVMERQEVENGTDAGMPVWFDLYVAVEFFQTEY